MKKPPRRKPISKTRQKGNPPPRQSQDTYRVRYGARGAYLEQLGYHAAEVIRSSGRKRAYGGSADSHLVYDLNDIRAESQAQDRDNGLYSGLINTGINNIIGNGFTLNPETGDETLDAELKAMWADWCRKPEVRGLDNWHQCERLALRHLWVDGDVGGIKTAAGLLQMIEAERIRSLNHRDSGVVLDDWGRPTAFHVADYSETGRVVPSEKEPIPAANFLFMANRQRISQTRGVPVLTSDLPQIHRINDICDCEAVAWQLLSRIALVVNKRDADIISHQTSEANAVTGDADFAARYHDIGNGIVFHGEPGEEVRGVERNIPGDNFSESLTMFLRLLGLPLGYCLELVLLDWSKTTYSSARAALLQAYRMFQVWQELLKHAWHSPIYEWQLSRWIPNLGAVAANMPTISRHSWMAPPFPWIDVLKESQAEGERLDRGFGTHTEVLASQNVDRRDWLSRRQSEVRDAVETAKALAAETGQNIPWQMFCGVGINIKNDVPKPGIEEPFPQEPPQ